MNNYCIEEATITSLNINQEGLDTTAVTITNYEHNDIKPDYGAIATGAAVTGLVAGGLVTFGEWLNSKPSLETPTEGAAYKPDPGIVGPGQPFDVSEWNGSWGGGSVDNLGTANLTVDINLVGKPIQPVPITDQFGNIVQPPSWHMQNTLD